ncbi:protein ImuA [Rhizobium leguminosarum]|uniref:Protein ImuA n=1 Tax=Rhizobium leguminosarum TaxID=384 RepID=A0AAE2SX54_RHILE|nr:MULTISPECIES: ImuA family protein [Rhizobium]MBB4291447.1 protein ImuA [Rhizobium leguminosarum]MBB4296144.1 protein ImuA [Rhizobium leguminosarum]MBB4308597.1 protein ImuA [Rhizobium leguminosarum]MBB4416432.1 protein ImuA [Rhizobium leguminosarum]MBB4430601.1 protein ImuA [Rhizobium esperanzae]
MAQMSASTIISELRERIAHLEGGIARNAIVLPFGVPEIDRVLPGGGLTFGALHEFAGGGTGTVNGAAAALMVAGIAARTTGKILWCLTRPDLFFPAISQAGLHPDRVIFCEGDKEEDVLASMEEGLTFGGFGAVVGELVRLPMTASRRLHLAAEKTGTMALAVRRWRRQAEASDYGQPTASTSRWRISVLPSEPLPVAGVGRARWLAELMRVKAGECAEFEIGACDAEGRICLLPLSGDGSDQTAWRTRGAG